VQDDKDFARVYIREKRDLLPLLVVDKEPHKKLLTIAWEQVNSAVAKLGLDN
jgi:hypothetical protein